MNPRAPESESLQDAVLETASPPVPLSPPLIPNPRASTIPAIQLEHLSEAEVRACVTADKLAELARWDRDLLSIELQDLANSGDPPCVTRTLASVTSS